MKLTVGALLLVVFFSVGCGSSPPQPITVINVTIPTELRERLSPAVQSLLSDIESGKAAGASATDYATAISEATEVHRRQSHTDYLIGLETELEGHPTIAVRVDKKDGRIVKCAVTKPEW